MDFNLSFERHYRPTVYGCYASAHMPAWLRTDPSSNATWLRAALRRVRGWLPVDKNAKCLDLGCGAGHVLMALRAAG